MDSAQRTGISSASPHRRRELTCDEVRWELQRAFEIQSRSRAQLEADQSSREPAQCRLR
jgi:hypothetical protein